MSTPTIESILRATQAFCSQLCEKETLTHGICYHCERYPNLNEANQFREVIVEDPAIFATTFSQAEEWFTSRGLTCLRWAPAAHTDTTELAGHLTSRGFIERKYHAMHLGEWPEFETPAGVRVLPARAMRAAYRQTFMMDAADGDRERSEQLADSYGERLDDPQFDMFVALVQGEPAGRCALHQVGDIGCVTGLHVGDRNGHPDTSDALLGHVLSLAKRVGMRKLCVQAALDDAPQTTWLEQRGFIRDGIIVEYDKLLDSADHQGPC